MTGIKLECLGETWLCAYCSHWYFKTFPPHIFLCMSDTRSHICLCTIPSPWLTLGTFTPTCLFQASPHLAWLLLIASYCVVLSLVWLFATPLDCSLPGSSAHGIFQAAYGSGLTFPTPGDLPNAGIEPMSLESLALAGGFFTSAPPGKPS